MRQRVEKAGMARILLWYNGGILFDWRVLMLWTPKQAAWYLGVNLHHVYYLINMGRIEAVKVGRAWRVVPEGVIYGLE